MTWFGRWAKRTALACLAATLAWGVAQADVLTADRAVELALKHNLDVINAQGNVMDGRGLLYGAYGGVLPNLSANYTRRDARLDNQTGQQVFGTVVAPSSLKEYKSNSTTTQVGATWSILDLSALSSARSARSGSRGAEQRYGAARNDVVLAARRQFYEVVKTIRLADVADRTVGLARDNERRVRALFEVGSVSKSDLLKAQVRTSQSELDSIVAHANITIQRVNLATLVGVAEAALGDIDTVLVVTPRSYDEAQVLTEAVKNRPDLLAVESELASARSNLTAAHLARVPSVVVAGSMDFNPESETTITNPDSTGALVSEVTTNKTERQWASSVALTWRYGLGTEGRVQSARARVLRAEEAAAAAERNVAGEVKQALLVFTQSIEGEKVARRALESAREDLKLTQEKYNVGSATILDLLDSQVALSRAASDLVTALATIRQAEAQVERVRGVYPK